jgi:hypothetical protein
MPDHSAIAPDLTQARTAAMSPSRPPPKWIKVLLPVWGYEFTQQFLKLSLPTLLAPGNLPALAKTMPTGFIFLIYNRTQGRSDDPRERRLSPPVEILQRRFLSDR